MRRRSLLAAAILLGYATGGTAALPCNISTASGWHDVSAPANAGQLLKLVPTPDPDLKVLDLDRAYQHIPKHWFARPDGSLLLCRTPDKPPAPGCNSDLWQFRKVQGKWVATRLSATMCIE